jgi:hypothetical protein
VDTSLFPLSLNTRFGFELPSGFVVDLLSKSSPHHSRSGYETSLLLFVNFDSFPEWLSKILNICKMCGSHKFDHKLNICGRLC